MERRKLIALSDYNADVPKRAPYYEDHAKPAWISAPVMAVAAAALLVGGHLLSRRAGENSLALTFPCRHLSSFIGSAGNGKPQLFSFFLSDIVPLASESSRWPAI